jgi:hypothetical protein
VVGEQAGYRLAGGWGEGCGSDGSAIPRLAETPEPEVMFVVGPR